MLDGEGTRREAARRDAAVEHEERVTVVRAEFPPAARRPRIINRGRPSACCCTPTASCAPRGPRSFLGMDDPGIRPARAEETGFPPGATPLFHTDGLSGARDARGVFHDPAE